MKERKEKIKKDLTRYIGIIDDETAERMLKSVKEFRKLKSRRFR
jgi:ribosomal protein S25